MTGNHFKLKNSVTPGLIAVALSNQSLRQFFPLVENIPKPQKKCQKTYQIVVQQTNNSMIAPTLSVSRKTVHGNEMFMFREMALPMK